MILKSLNKDEFNLCIQQLPTGRWDEFNVPTMKKTDQTMKPNDHNTMLIDEIGINNCMIQIFETNLNLLTYES